MIQAATSSVKSGAARGDDTRLALLAAATVVFAQHGFAAASLREITQAARVNQALVSYHFGGKEGLYLAVFEDIVERMQLQLGPLSERVLSDLTRRLTRAQLLAHLFELTDNMLYTMSSEQSAHWAQLIVREQLAPTKAFDIVFNGFEKGLLDLLTQIVRRLRPANSTIDARLVVVGILGQTLAFRVARAGVLRHMQWQKIGPTELALAQAHMREHLTLLLAD